MNKSKKVRILIAFLFGVCFVTGGLCLYGIINDGASLFSGLGNPAYWILGVLFGLILALNTRIGKAGKAAKQ